MYGDVQEEEDKRKQLTAKLASKESAEAAAKALAKKVRKEEKLAAIFAADKLSDAPSPPPSPPPPPPPPLALMPIPPPPPQDLLLPDIFDSIDAVGIDVGSHGNELSPCSVPPPLSLPEELCCPITWSLFVDPVTLSDGHVYSRAAIFEWLRRGKCYSPVIGAPLSNVVLIPCHPIHSQVVRWCEDNGLQPPLRNELPS